MENIRLKPEAMKLIVQICVEAKLRAMKEKGNQSSEELERVAGC